jgi:hypothetical protein
MTEKEKQKKLKELDELVLDRMIDMVDKRKYDELSDLSVAVNYLKSNAVVAEKSKGTIEEEVKERKAKAAKRREEAARKKAEEDTDV